MAKKPSNKTKEVIEGCGVEKSSVHRNNNEQEESKIKREDNARRSDFSINETVHPRGERDMSVLQIIYKISSRSHRQNVDFERQSNDCVIDNSRERAYGTDMESQHRDPGAVRVYPSGRSDSSSEEDVSSENQDVEGIDNDGNNSIENITSTPNHDSSTVLLEAVLVEESGFHIPRCYCILLAVSLVVAAAVAIGVGVWSATGSPDSSYNDNKAPRTSLPDTLGDQSPFTYQTSYGIAWGTSAIGCSSYQNSPNLTIQCGQEKEGMISLLSSSRNVTCHHLSNSQLSCQVQDHQPSSNVAITCGSNSSSNNMEASASLHHTTIKDCSKELYSEPLRTSHEDHELSFGGVGGIYINMGKFCFNGALDKWKLLQTAESANFSSGFSYGSCAAVQQCNDNAGCTGNTACNASVGPLDASYPDVDDRACARTRANDNPFPPLQYIEEGVVFPSLQDAGQGGFRTAMLKEMDLISVRPEEPLWTFPPDNRAPNTRTRPPTTAAPVLTPAPTVPSDSRLPEKTLPPGRNFYPH